MSIRLVVGNFCSFTKVTVVMDILVFVVWRGVSIATAPSTLVHPVWRNGTAFVVLLIPLGMLVVIVVNLAAKMEKIVDLHAADDFVDAGVMCCGQWTGQRS